MALLAAHRHVFGVLLWYVLPPGPSGAILPPGGDARRAGAAWALGRFGSARSVAERPAVRITAASFAVVT
jgi:adenosylcobinamide-phosphate synthase